MHTTTNRNKSLRLSKIVYDDMKNYAKITDTPINALIREALVDFFRNTETKTERKYISIRNQRSILSDVKVPGETNEDNVLALTIGREIFAQIKPRTDSKEGDIVTSESVIVKNALPEVTNVKIGNINPVSNEDLILTWQFFDFEITALGNLTQSNQTRVEWFKFDRDANQFVKFENIGRINTTVETSSSILQSNGLTKQGDKWKAVVIPSDGLDEGVPVESNIVTIV